MRPFSYPTISPSAINPRSADAWLRAVHSVSPRTIRIRQRRPRMVGKIRINIRPYPRRLRFIRDRFDRVRRGGRRRGWVHWNRVDLRSPVRLGICLNTHGERVNIDHKCKRCASDPPGGANGSKRRTSRYTDYI